MSCCNPDNAANCIITGSFQGGLGMAIDNLTMITDRCHTSHNRTDMHTSYTHTSYTHTSFLRFEN